MPYQAKDTVTTLVNTYHSHAIIDPGKAAEALAQIHSLFDAEKARADSAEKRSGCAQQREDNAEHCDD